MKANLGIAVVAVKEMPLFLPTERQTLMRQRLRWCSGQAGWGCRWHGPCHFRKGPSTLAEEEDWCDEGSDAVPGPLNRRRSSRDPSPAVPIKSPFPALFSELFIRSLMFFATLPFFESK